MNLKYFRAKQGNFGDDLNPYIFKKLFGCLSSENYSDIDFYGIGTIIDNRIDVNSKSIFWGTGIRDISKIYKALNWEVYFLRGPISANILKSSYITDGAYTILLDDDFYLSHHKEYDISLIPHYHHMSRFNWQYINNCLDINIIDPRSSVTDVFSQIMKSKRIIASAMHGAIAADICRVPWMRMRMEIIPAETFFISDLKWNDWLLSMSLNDFFIQIRNYQINFDGQATALSHYELINCLKSIKLNNKLFQLSSNIVLNEKVKQIQEKVNLFKETYY